MIDPSIPMFPRRDLFAVTSTPVVAPVECFTEAGGHSAVRWRPARRRRFSALLAVLSVLVGASPLHAQESEVCGVYAAVLDSLYQDTTHVLVVYDSTSLATPTFGFHAYSGLGLPAAGSAVPLSDSLWEVMRAEHRDRDALPACIATGRTVVRVPYDSLRAPFRDRESGWRDFAAVFPGARGLALLGHPLFIDPDRREAMVYVGRAFHWLSGSGTIFYLRFADGRWQVHGSHRLWVS